DSSGMLVDETRTIGGTAYEKTMRYDAAGRLLGVTWPDGDAIGTPVAPLQYDGAGRLRAIPSFVADVSYDAAGRPLTQINVNSTKTKRTYSPARGLLTAFSVDGGASTILQLGYTRNSEGLITQLTSTTPGESWNYAYDDLHRLSEAQN